MERRVPAVFSPAAAVIFVLIAGLICALLEGARVTEMKQLAPYRVKLLGQNIFSNYQAELYEKYGLLGLDEEYSQMGQGESVGNRLVSEEFSLEKELASKEPGISFLNYSQMELTDEQIQLLSDYDGQVFLKQAAKCMLPVLPEGKEKEVERTLSDFEDFQRENDTEAHVGDAQEALDTATSMQEVEEDEEPSQICVGEIEEYSQRKSQPILSLLHLPKEPSSKPLLPQYCPSERRLLRGSTAGEGVTIPELVLANLYCVKNFRNYQSADDKGEVFQYQTEYLIAGRKSDAENLEVVARRILLIREAVQFARMLKDPVKMEKAEGIALAAVGFTCNPVLIKAVQLGIIAAWSFEEALNDVRKLLAGEKLSIFSKEENRLWGYEEYLQFLLFMTGHDVWGRRALDILEHEVNTSLKVGSFHVDRTITGIKGKVQAEIPWVFANVLSLSKYQKTGLSTQVIWEENYN